jgi:hypothetical protein
LGAFQPHRSRIDVIVFPILALSNNACPQA